MNAMEFLRCGRGYKGNAGEVNDAIGTSVKDDGANGGGICHVAWLIGRTSKP
jgi:hypothetical protein